MSENNFFIVVTSERKTRDDIVTFEAWQQQGNWFNSRKYFTFERCGPAFNEKARHVFQGRKSDAYLDKLIENALCLKDYQNAFIRSDYISPNFGAIWISLKYCREENPDNPNCASEEETEWYLKRFGPSVVYFYNYFDHDI